MRVHLVYPHNANVIAAPWSIGNHLAAGLRSRGYTVKQYDWESTETILPERGDVLLGHPCPTFGRVFLNSLAGWWSKKIALCPFNGSKENVEFVTSWIAGVDKYLAICGPYWAGKLTGSSTVPIDMAVDGSEFPRTVKFKPPGKRSIVYIGCTLECKGTDRLAYLSTVLDAKIYHYGPGVVGGSVIDMGTRGFWGGVPDADFVISTGINDANPTSILEGASWGMVAFCSKTAGWGGDIALTLPDDMGDAPRMLQWWLGAPTDLLEKRRNKVDEALPKYSWGAFVDKVTRTIEGE